MCLSLFFFFFLPTIPFSQQQVRCVCGGSLLLMTLIVIDMIETNMVLDDTSFVQYSVLARHLRHHKGIKY